MNISSTVMCYVIEKTGTVGYRNSVTHCGSGAQNPRVRHIPSEYAGLTGIYFHFVNRIRLC